MENHPRKRKLVRQRLIAITVAISLILGAGGFKWVTGQWPFVGYPSTEPAVELPNVPVGEKHTSLQQVRDYFGPWTLQTSQTLTNKNALVMLMENGTVDVSPRTDIIVGPQWNANKPFFLGGVKVEQSTVLLANSENKRFTIYVSQPFLLEEFPEQVHIVTGDGTVWSLPISIPS
jgi:hypothetical protein